jgi:hypothetical protein
MGNDLIPGRSTQEGGDKQPPKKKTSEKRAGNTKKHVIPTNGNKGTQVESDRRIFDIPFAILEFVALVIWMLAELFHGRNDFNLYGLFLWIAMTCFLAGAAHVVHKAINRPTLVWSAHGSICLILSCIVYSYTRPASESDNRVSHALSTAPMSSPARFVPFKVKRVEPLRPPQLEASVSIKIGNSSIRLPAVAEGFVGGKDVFLWFGVAGS